MNAFIDNVVRLFGRSAGARRRGPHAAPRRLTIEPMESRTMLSATTIGFEVVGSEWTWQQLEKLPVENISSHVIRPFGTNPFGTNPFGTNPVGTNPVGTNPVEWRPVEQNLVDAYTIRDGGFVSIGALDTLSFFDADVGASGRTNNSPIIGSLGASSNELNLNGRPAWWSGIADTDYTAADDFWGNDLPAATIDPSPLVSGGSSGGAAGSEFNPAPIDSSVGQGGEGGSVSIPAIAATLTSPRQDAASAGAIARRGVHGARDHGGDLLATHLSAESISGEWARAVAFETVYEVPERAERQASGESPAEPASLTGLLRLDPSSPFDGEIERRAAQAEAAGDAPAHEEQASAGRVEIVPGAELVQLAGLLAMPGVTSLIPMALGEQLLMAGGDEAPNGEQDAPRPAREAVDEAFAELAPEVVNEPQPLSHRDLWSLTPLMLVVALERIASANSRRSKESPEAANRFFATRSEA